MILGLIWREVIKDPIARINMLPSHVKLPFYPLCEIKCKLQNEMSTHRFKIYLYIYIYIYTGWVQVTPDITLSNVTPLNNLLLNSYFENPTVVLYVLYGLNMHANFHANRM